MQYGQNISIPYTQTQTDHNFLNNTDQKNKNQIKMDRDREDVINQQILQNVNQSWQTLANPGNTVDYSSHLLSAASLPLTIQHFLKYSETIKKETAVVGTPTTSNSGNLNLNVNGMDGITGFNIKTDVLNLKNGLGSNVNLTLNSGGAVQQQNNITTPVAVTPGFINQATTDATTTTVETASTVVATTATAAAPTTTKGKKKKKKAPKKFVEKKPRPKPGEIRETKALDGSTLFCCPECQMAYPERSLIEQHVISHAIERR